MKRILLAKVGFAGTLASADQTPPAQFARRIALSIGNSADCGSMGPDISTEQPAKKRVPAK